MPTVQLRPSLSGSSRTTGCSGQQPRARYMSAIKYNLEKSHFPFIIKFIFCNLCKFVCILILTPGRQSWSSMLVAFSSCSSPCGTSQSRSVCPSRTRAQCSSWWLSGTFSLVRTCNYYIVEECGLGIRPLAGVGGSTSLLINCLTCLVKLYYLKPWRFNVKVFKDVCN